MKSEVVLIVAIVCLMILGIVISYTQPEGAKLLYAIVGIIAAIAGVGGALVVPKIISKLRKRGND